MRGQNLWGPRIFANDGGAHDHLHVLPAEIGSKLVTSIGST
jgi:hypothetical protein